MTFMSGGCLRGPVVSTGGVNAVLCSRRRRRCTKFPFRAANRWRARMLVRGVVLIGRALRRIPVIQLRAALSEIQLAYWCPAAEMQVLE